MRVIVGATIAATLLIGGWYMLNSGESTTAFELPSRSSTPTRDVPKDWKEYRDEVHGFSVLYPSDLAVREHFGVGDVVTVSFEKGGEAPAGFQIYIAPYAESRVSEERFARDNPSGIRKALKAISIGGVHAESFFSVNSQLGETAEIWFVHGGYLYEVTTVKELASWLSPIMESWTFVKS